MSRLMHPRTVRNDLLRMSACYVFLMAQLVIPLTGCPSQAIPGDPNSGLAGGDAGAGDGGGAGGAGNGVAPGDAPSDAPRPAGALGLAGWWVTERDTPGGEKVWGHARADITSAVAETVTIYMWDDEGNEPHLSVTATDDAGRFNGYWATSFADFPATSDTFNWNATESADRDTLTSTWTSAEGDQAVTFHRASDPDYRMIGVWNRSTDNVPLVVAYDSGSGLLMSLLDGSGNWPDDGRYNADLYRDATPFRGNQGFDEFEGLVFGGGNRMHLRITSGDSTHGVNFQKAATQSELNGRWVGGDRRWRGVTASRSVRIVVEHDNTLYVHESSDYPQGLRRTFRAASDGTRYVDATAEGSGWSGKLTPDRTRIVGEWIGYEDWYNSMYRTVTPMADELVGEWSSVSLDWAHHTGSGDIVRAYGEATLTQSGNSLQIVDVYDGGVTYHVDATWVGDHYEGEWWDAAAPDARYSWRGELEASGEYLHGQWENGEWSFSPYPNVAADEIPEDVNIVYIADPYDDRAIVMRAPDTNRTATFFRGQQRINSAAIGAPDGELEVTFDERMRPTEVVGYGETITIAWSDDATSIDVTVRRDSDGATTSATLPIDLSDAALLDMIAGQEAALGIDLSEMRDWIADNPGYVQGLANGTISSPTFDEELAKRLTQVPRGHGAELFGNLLNLSAAGATVLAAAGLALKTAAGTGGLAFLSAGAVASLSSGLIIAAGVVGAIGVLVLGSILIANLLIAILGDCCAVCNLACFVNCCPPADDD